MRCIVWLILFVCSAHFAAAQVSVEIQLDQEQYMPNELMMARVRITNLSGQSIKMGTTPEWLTFLLEERESMQVPQSDPPDVQREFVSESGTTTTLKVELSRSYNLYKSGRYTLVAMVKVPQWNETFVSKGKVFEINPGSKLWEIVFGVPPSKADQQGLPETRKYVLQRRISPKSMQLYFRLTDPEESRNFRVYPIAPIVSFGLPEHQLDGESNLHVLHQTGAKSFNYSVINPDGRMIIRQTYEYTATRPTLKPDRNGKLGVAGGLRRISGTDYPAPPDTESTDARKP